MSRALSSEVLGLPIPEGELTTGRFIEGAARRHGARTAIVAGGRRIGYDELYAGCRGMARALMALGIAPGARVAILLANGPDFVTTWYGCGLAGAVAVPISTYATPTEIEQMLDRSEAELLILQPRLAKRSYIEELPDRLTRLSRLRTVAVSRGPAVTGTTTLDALLARGDAVSEADLRRRADAVDPEDLATILFTSGSTGVPKGIRHAHRAPVIQSWRWAQVLSLAASDVCWNAYPFFWSAGLAMGMGGPLACGATVLLQELFDANAALDAIATERATAILSSAHIDPQLAAAQNEKPRNLETLRTDRIGVQLAAALGRADYVERGTGYGLTEMFTIATWIPPEATLEQRLKTHGHVLAGEDLRIIDPQSGRELPPGELGEIAVRGATLMLGYLDPSGEAAFDANGFHRPGDAGYVDADGMIRWEGRVREMIRTRGANVAPVEIERALIDWGGLLRGRAIGLPHPRHGEAIVVCGLRRPGDAAPPSEEDVVRGLKERLSSYKLPQRVFFVDEAELSLTGTQKVRADELKRLIARRIIDEAADPEWSRHLREKGLAAQPAGPEREIA